MFKKSNAEPSFFYQWSVLVAASLMFFYSFIEMNMLNPIGVTIMHSFSINAVQLGTLSSMYFYGNFLLIFLAGLILDRISPRKILLISLLIASITMFVFACSTHLIFAEISRFISGLCGAFALIGAMRVVSRWFHGKNLALASGCVVAIAVIGGVVAQTPVAVLSQLLGWRGALCIFGIFGLILTLIVFFVLCDYPPNYLIDSKEVGAENKNSLGFWCGIKMVISNRYNWFGALYATFMNLPVILLGALWGTMYLTQVHHLTIMQSTNVTTALFVGMLIGSPLIGWFSDKLKRRIVPMIVGAILSLAILLSIMYVTKLSFTSLLILFFLLGFITSTLFLTYSIITELNSPLVTASAISIISTLLMACGFVAQPLFGWLLSLHWNHLIVHHVAIYSVLNFRRAMWIIPIGFMISLICVFFIKETRCEMRFKA